MKVTRVTIDLEFSLDEAETRVDQAISASRHPKISPAELQPLGGIENRTSYISRSDLYPPTRDRLTSWRESSHLLEPFDSGTSLPTANRTAKSFVTHHSKRKTFSRFAQFDTTHKTRPQQADTDQLPSGEKQSQTTQQGTDLPMVHSNSRNTSVEKSHPTSTEFLAHQRKAHSHSLISQRSKQESSNFGLKEAAVQYEFGINSFVQPDPKRPPSYVMPRNTFKPIYTTHTVPSAEDLPELTAHGVVSSVLASADGGSSPPKHKTSGLADYITRRDCFDWKYLPKKKSKAEQAEPKSGFPIDLAVAPESPGLDARSVLADRRIVRAMVKKFYKNNQHLGDAIEHLISPSDIPLPEPRAFKPAFDKKSQQPVDNRQMLSVCTKTKPSFNFVGVHAGDERKSSKQPIRLAKLVLAEAESTPTSKTSEIGRRIEGSAPGTPKRSENRTTLTSRQITESIAASVGPMLKRGKQCCVLTRDTSQNKPGEIPEYTTESQQSSPRHSRPVGVLRHLESKTARATVSDAGKAKVEFKNMRIGLDKYGQFLGRQAEIQTKNIFKELLDPEKPGRSLPRGVAIDKHHQESGRPECRISRSRPALQEVQSAADLETNGSNAAPSWLVGTQSRSFARRNHLPSRGNNMPQPMTLTAIQTNDQGTSKTQRTHTETHSPEEKYMKRYRGRNFSIL